MPSRRLIIGVSRTHVRVEPWSGGAWGVSWRVDEGDQPWAESLEEMADRISAVVDERAMRGWRATVVYSSPATVTLLHSCPSGAGARGALSAARLALADAAGAPLEDDPVALVPAGRDADAGDVDAPSRTHTLAAVERDAEATALSRMIESAGLRLDWLVPESGVALASCVGALERAGGALAVACWVGEHESVVAGSMGGRLRFARRLAGIGTESMVDALASASDELGGLSRSEAEELLRAEGVPEAGCGRAKADLMLPRLQPTLQRLIVEIRQSLRSVSAEGSTGVLAVIGPGCRLPRLASVLAEQTRLELVAEAGGMGTPLEAARAMWGRVPLLLPTAARRARAAGRLRRGVMIGAAAGVALLVADAARLAVTAGRAQARISALEARLSRTAPPIELAQRVEAMERAIARTDGQVRSMIGELPVAHAVLGLLSSATPSSVVLRQVELVRGESTRCVVRGDATAPDAGAAGEIVRAYMEALGAAPIVRGVRLVNTQRREERGACMERFELAVDLTPPTAGASLAGGW